MHLLNDDGKIATSDAARTEPTPARIFDTLLFAHLRGDALKAAVDLALFTAIADGAVTADAIAAKCSASPRGIASLCNFLTVNGFLSKSDDRYDLTPESRLFLNQHSPAYVGSVAAFLGSCREAFAKVGESVRTGVAAESISDECWLTFADSMIPLAAPVARAAAERLDAASLGAIEVLDIAASHGEYGLAIARANPHARIVAIDLPQVVERAARRAKQSGFADRYRAIPGSVFDVSLEGPYDLVLLPNLLHSFDRTTNEKLLAKIFAAVKPGGRLATIDFVPNDDRVSPAWPAQFSLVMVAQNAGNTYTFSEIDAWLRKAGFAASESYPLPPSPQTMIVSKKH
jgi:SAM-dependent methyltransferase